MDQLINQNLEQREQTRAALARKIELLQKRLQDSIEQVKAGIRRTTDVKYQVSQRPWLMVGFSVLAGRVIGGMLGGGRRSRRRAIARRRYVADDYRQQRSVVKGAVIGAITSLTSEFARHAIPMLVRRLESSWQNKPSGSEYTNTRNSHYHEH
jgi:ElaB/YqjD/DUF883 family membrane-anchored ribosome-binding protein